MSPLRLNDFTASSGPPRVPSPQDKETTVRTPGEIILLVDFQEQESDHIPETMTNVMGC